jgi:hypothetical protein
MRNQYVSCPVLNIQGDLWYLYVPCDKIGVLNKTEWVWDQTRNDAYSSDSEYSLSDLIGTPMFVVRNKVFYADIVHEDFDAESVFSRLGSKLQVS